MIQRLLILMVGLLLPALVAPSLGAVFDHAPPGEPGETYGIAEFRIHVPDIDRPIRGIFFRVAPHLSDSRSEVADPDFRKLCESQDFALLGARLDDLGMETGVGDALLRTLAVFAKASGHPELAFAPLYFEGYSWGGQFAYHFTVWRPERVLGFVTMKGGYHRTDLAGEAILVPGYLFIGANDLQYRIDNLTGIFAEHRPLGARWILAMQPDAGHEAINDRNLLDDYFTTVVQARLPEPMPDGTLPDLQVMPEMDSWLGDRERQLIGQWLCYDASPDSACWLPTRSIAKTWQDFVSDGAVNDTIDCVTAVPDMPLATARLLPNRPNPFNPATTIVYELGEPGTVELRLFNLKGGLITSLVAGEWRGAGRHECTWNGRDRGGREMPTGSYLCQLKVDREIHSQRLLLVR